MVLSVTDVLDKGLVYIRVDLQKKWSKERRIDAFKQHFGSSLLTLASAWYDLTVTELGTQMIGT